MRLKDLIEPLRMDREQKQKESTKVISQSQVVTEESPSSLRQYFWSRRWELLAITATGAILGGLMGALLL